MLSSIDISQPQPQRVDTTTIPLISRDEVEAMISNGRKIIIFRQQVLKVDAWLMYHPGGDKTILHMVGRDATDEVEALHSPKAKQQMLRYCIGRIEGVWTNFKAPIQGGTFGAPDDLKTEQEDDSEGAKVQDSASQISSASPLVLDTNANGLRCRAATVRNGKIWTEQPTSDPATEVPADGISYLDSITHEHISIDLEKYPAVDVATQALIATKYKELHRKVIDAGLYNTNYAAYGIECCRYAFCFGMMLAALLYGHYAIGGAFLGFMWHQLVFAAHDAGHMGITHGYHADSIIAIVIADFIGGLSMGWWKHNHNVHHIMTNAPEHDPDIEHMPLFAISHRLLGSLRSTFYNRVMEYDAFAKALLRIQPWTYYPFLALGRFNLYYLSWDHILARRGPRKGAAAWLWWFELVGQAFFWTWFGYGILYKMIPNAWSRFVFIMVSHIASSPLHLQIVLSHFAMSTSDLGPQESFAQKMLRTTMDIDCPPWLDFIHGGLQFQVVHHLFPRLPRHNLRKGQKYVQQFCKDVDIPYAYYGFANGNKHVVRKLAEVSRQAAILSKCQEAITRDGRFSGHDH